MDSAQWQVVLTMMSPHINNLFAKKRGIGKNLLLTVRTLMCREQLDMVTGDFNGAAWRRQSGSDPRPISTIEEAFANTSLPIPPVPTPLWRPVHTRWIVGCVCGVLKPLGSENGWQVRMHGAFTIPFGMLGIKHADQSCHREVWIHTSSTSMLGWLIVYHGRHISPAKFEKEELTLRPQQGKEATSVKRDYSHPRYVSPMWQRTASVSRQAPGTTLKSGKERVRRWVLFRSVSLMSVVLAFCMELSERFRIKLRFTLLLKQG